MSKIIEVCFRLLNSSAIAKMRGRPEYKDWRNNLLELRNNPQLTPLTKAIDSMAADNLVTVDSFKQFLGTEAIGIPADVYVQGSEVAAATASLPHAAFLLAWICLIGWSTRLGKDLYTQVNGIPQQGWLKVPYICSSAAFRIGAFEEAKLLADEGYEVLMSCKFWYEEDFRWQIEAYRQLSARSWRKYELALANLVDDLRDSCRPGNQNFRAEMGALLWSLGYVPESMLLRVGAPPNWIPSRQFLLSIVRQSMLIISSDPLVQYVWLELKDRPGFNLRSHRLLFQRINTYWSQSPLDELSPDPPSRSYARALIGWFGGKLTDKLGQDFLQGYELHRAQFPSVNLIDFIRLTSLARIVVNELGWTTPDFTNQEEMESWFKIADLGRRVMEVSNLHPEWPRIYCRVNIGIFHIHESVLSGNNAAPSASDAGVDRAFRALEEIRAAAISFWLFMVPPFAPPQEEQVLLTNTEQEQGLPTIAEQEQEMLSYLRGAHFQILTPILPKHFSFPMEQIQDDMAKGWNLFDPEVGRKQFKKLIKDLDSLYNSCLTIAPQYAKKRLQSSVDLRGAMHLISSHRKPGP
jgi:hypothetical protein